MHYGADYNPEQWPEELWPEDVARMRAHEKMPRLTMVTPASRIRATSSGQSSSGHCSGL